MVNQEVIQHVTEGGVPAQPKDCPARIYDQLLKPCFAFKADDRPSFSTLLRLLETLATLDPSRPPSDRAQAIQASYASDYYFTASSSGSQAYWPMSGSSDSDVDRNVRNEPDYDLTEAGSPTYIAASAIFAALDKHASSGADLAQLSADIQHQLPEGLQVTLEMEPELDSEPGSLSLPTGQPDLSALLKALSSEV
jgi:hypothetical protein